MRTTLTIDDDIAGVLKRRAAELGKPWKEVVNMALRKGVSESGNTPHQTIVKVRPHDFGFKAGIDFDRLNQLNDELEIEEYLRKTDDSA